MTNLNSEQYRDVIKYIENCTEKPPTVQHLLRAAVIAFFEKFGEYPELGGVAPGKVSIFGEQTQFDGGLALSSALQMATVVVGRRARGPRYTVVTTGDVGKPHKVEFSFSRNRPLAPGNPEWLNIVKGVIEKYEETVPPFEAVISSSVPVGVGLGSTSSVETAVFSFLEVLVGKKVDPVEKAKACQRVERDFRSKEVGLVDRMAAVLAKDRHAMLLDCATNEIEWVPLNSEEVSFVAVDSHEKDLLFGHEYSERSKYIRKACQMLNVESLRSCTEQDLSELQSKVERLLNEDEGTKASEPEEEVNEGKRGRKDKEPNTAETIKYREAKKRGQTEEEEDAEVWSKEEYETMVSSAKFFIKETERITKALEAWKEGDFETFGKKMEESHRSLKEDFNLSNPLLNFLVETSLQVEGVLGSKMTGMGLGFGGGVLTILKKRQIEKYCKYLTDSFDANQGRILDEIKEQRIKDKEKISEVRKNARNQTLRDRYNPPVTSLEQSKKLQSYLENGDETLYKIDSKRVYPDDRARINDAKSKRPCIVRVERQPGGCKTWDRQEKGRQEENFSQKKSIEEEEREKKTKEAEEGNDGRRESASALSDRQRLVAPSFYIVSPFAGARMMFVSKTDFLRSLFARPVPHPKRLVRSALEEFATAYAGVKAEAVGVAPGTLTLFGEFMEYHLGYIVCMALPLTTVTVGGRNDTVCFSVRTMSEEIEEPKRMRSPLPCVRPLETDSQTWANLVTGCVNEFKGHVPGFDAIVNSSVPIQMGLNSCSALQASLYTFLENLTGNCTGDSLEKADRCAKSEYEFQETPSELVTRCSTIKFFPTFLCKEGNLMFVNCKRYKISQYFFDHPSYVFLIGCCRKNTTKVTVESLDERLKTCIKALDTLGINSLLSADIKHLRCLMKRNAGDEVVKRAKYVITEHQRTIEAVKAIREENYERVGLLMNQSHASLRDDYEVSSPEIETLVSLAAHADGVLGVKMLGRGLNASVVILAKISEADKCIRHMRKNYRPRNDKPVFYVTKPSRGAFMMNPAIELALVP